MNNKNNRYNNPNDLCLRIAIWETYNRRDIYFGNYIPFRELQIDHIIPQSLWKEGKEDERIEILEKYGLDSSFEKNDLLNFVPSSGFSNKSKSDKLIPVLTAFALEAAKKNKGLIVHKIDQYYTSFNNITDVLTIRNQLIGKDGYIEELYEFIDVLLDDVKDYEVKNVDSDYMELSKKRIRLFGICPDLDNGFRPTCTVEFRTLKARDITVVLDYKYIYRTILPTYKRDFSDRSYIKYQNNTNECFVRFTGVSVHLHKSEAKELCELFDKYSEKIFNELNNITQKYSLTRFEVDNRELLILKINKDIIQKLYEFVQENPIFGNYDLSESRRDVIKIKENNSYHGILYFKCSPNNQWYNNEEYYIYESTSYLDDNESEPIWGPDQLRRFLIKVIEKALEYSYQKSHRKPFLYSKKSLFFNEMQEEIQKNINDIIFYNKPASMFVTSEIENGYMLNDCLSKMGLYFNTNPMTNKYYISNNIYRAVNYLNNKFLLESDDYSFFLSKLGFTEDIKKHELNTKLQLLIDNHSSMYSAQEIRAILEALQCYTRRENMLGYKEIKLVIEDLKDVIDVYNREMIIRKYMD